MNENVTNLTNNGEQKQEKKRKQQVGVPVTVYWNKSVYDYTIKNLRELCGQKINSVYRQIKKSGGIVLQNYVNTLQQVNDLIERVEDFTPNMPMTVKDSAKLKSFFTKWQNKLLQIKNQLQHTGTPVYFQTEVAKILKKRKAKVEFHEVMLEWYIERFGCDNITPENIADAVMQQNVKDWSEVKQLARPCRYSFRLAADTEDERNFMLNAVRWIYRIEITDVDKDLGAHVANDLVLMKALKKWNDKKVPKSYHYEKEYQEFINQLQTITPQQLFEIDDESKSGGTDTEQSEVTQSHETDTAIGGVEKSDMPMQTQTEVTDSEISTGAVDDDQKDLQKEEVPSGEGDTSTETENGQGEVAAASYNHQSSAGLAHQATDNSLVQGAQSDNHQQPVDVYEKAKRTYEAASLFV